LKVVVVPAAAMSALSQMHQTKLLKIGVIQAQAGVLTRWSRK